MITVLVSATVKKNRLDEFRELAMLLTKESRKRPGCITYTFNQSVDNPTKFVLYEQWQSESDLESHIQELLVLLGPSKPDGVLPEKLVDMYEKAKANYFVAIE